MLDTTYESLPVLEVEEKWPKRALEHRKRFQGWKPNSIVYSFYNIGCKQIDLEPRY